MAQINVNDATGAVVTLEAPLAPGRAGQAASKPVVLSTEDLAAINANTTAVNAGNALLTTQNTYLDGVESLLTQSVNLITTQNGYLDGVETLIGATNTLITTQNGYLDGVETLIGATNTKLDTVIASVDGLEGFTDGLETLITSTNALLTTQNGYLDGVEGYIDGLETLITSTNAKLDALNVALTDANTTLDAIDTTVGTPTTSLPPTQTVATLDLTPNTIDSVSTSDIPVVTGSNGMTIRVHRFDFEVSAACVVSLYSDASNAVNNTPLRTWNFTSAGGVVRDFDPRPYFVAAAGKDLILKKSTSARLTGNFETIKS